MESKGEEIKGLDDFTGKVVTEKGEELPIETCMTDEESKTLVTEKQIFTLEEMVADEAVDTTEIHLCGHDEGLPCKIVGLNEAQVIFSTK